MAEPGYSCVQPAKGPLVEPEVSEPSNASQSLEKEDVKMTVRVGKAAPDFEAVAYIDGDFKNVKLSDYKGQWVVLCFYPGDFTFV